MTIDEAISVLAAKRLDDVARNAMMSAEACQLGIEALKYAQGMRAWGHVAAPDPFPGETKD